MNFSAVADRTMATIKEISVDNFASLGAAERRPLAEVQKESLPVGDSSNAS
jgi:hypothetical protein